MFTEDIKFIGIIERENTFLEGKTKYYKFNAISSSLSVFLSPSLSLSLSFFLFAFWGLTHSAGKLPS